jgi:hypothetical protein
LSSLMIASPSRIFRLIWLKTSGVGGLCDRQLPTKGCRPAGSRTYLALGAYDAESDSFLVLDVNPASAGWVWMPTATLVKGMRTFDTVEKTPDEPEPPFSKSLISLKLSDDGQISRDQFANWPAGLPRFTISFA